MINSVVCIACLSSDLKMYSIQNTELSKIFENLTNSKVSNLDGISQSLCYICYSHLQKCCRFIKMSQKAGDVLTHLHNDKIQITPSTVSALDERTKYVTIVKQSSILLNETDANESDGEETGCNINVGSSKIQLEVLDFVKEEPEDIDVEMTNEDDFVAIKHEPTEAINYFTPQRCAVLKKEDDSTKNQTEIITELAASIKSQIHNNSLASHSNENKTETKRKATKTIKRKPKQIHQCNFCDLICGSRAYLLRHVRTHTGEKPYTCSHCGKSFAQSGHLIQHIRLHTGEKPFECYICENKSFNHRYNYKTHMKKHFGKPTHTCDLCKSAFHQKGDLKRHMMSHTGEKPYACNMCDMKFSQNCHLTKHKKTHMKKQYSCEYCSQTFDHKLDFNNHMTTHKRPEMFPCPYEECNKSFTKRNTLSCHMKSHVRGKPYDCVKCERTFKQKGHLTKHVIMVHDKEECDPTEKKNNEELNEEKQDQDKLQQKSLLQQHLEEYIIP